MGSDIFLIKEECRVVRIITLIVVAALIITLPVIGSAESKQGKAVNLTGGGLCPNSAASLVKEEVAKLKPGETVTLIIETENKDLITSAIKLEKLPVIFEEITEKDLTRFIIRLK